MNETQQDPQQSAHPGWQQLPAGHLPRPAYFPAGLAMGTTFIFWGIISSWIVLVIGLGLFIAAFAGWITEIRHERKHQ